MKKIKNISKKRKEKSKKSEEKESRLEEEIKEVKKEEKEIERNAEQEDDFFEEPIRQIPISAEIGAPVLERIIQKNAPIDNPIEIEQPRERGERRIDYSPASNQPNYGFARNREENQEKKYESTFVPPVLSRREISGNEMKQEFLRPQGEAWNNRTNEHQLENVDVMEQETRLPFEEQKKYKRHKLR